jgi:pyruvate/2-oxoglutarate dehydrogenase complex dihydrolipoamide acyltransferase (E2) component
VAVEVLLPKLGLTMETGLIEEWLVPPGTPVKPGDLLLRLATDKVDVEVEAEGTGLFHPAVASGVELPPGTLIGWLLEAGEQVPSGAAAPPAPLAPAAPPHVPAQPQTPVVGEPGAITRTGRLFASPNARRVAGQQGVDIAQLNGTGPGGRIITADVLEAAAAPGAPAPAPQIV